MTFREILISSVAVLAGTALVARAEPKDDLSAAAKKLADSENYTWTTTTQGAGGGGGGGGGGAMQGKTQKDGLTWLSIARQDNVVEAVFKGDKGAVKTQNGWEPLPEPGQGRGAGGGGAGAGGGPGGGGAMRNPAVMISRMIRNYRSPAVQAEELISKADNLKQDGDAYTGTLSEEAAKSLMTMGRGRGNRAGGGGGGGGGQGAGGGQGPDIKDAHGDVKFWIHDGLLSKYESHLQGTMNVQGEDRPIDRTSTVEIKDVGTTKLEVPDEAKQKAGL